ncbi:MAG: hypothetical protein NC489_22250 [Ruminococcus flavefaciens]|nr:hypothetical protein [Ruminococcus flavefaciens]
MIRKKQAERNVSEPLYDNSGIPYGRNTQQLSEYRDRTEQVFGNGSETSCKNLKNRKEVRKQMQNLKRIEFDFERKSFKINGEDVSGTEFFSIKFEDGEWEVTIKTRLYVSGQIKASDKKRNEA